VDFGALVGQSFLLDGESWEVAVEADTNTRLVKYTRATTGRTGEEGPAENDTDDELGDALSPSTVLYIPFDVCCTYVSTSRMWSASCASGMYLRVWGLVGRYAGGGLLRVVRLFFRPGGPREGAGAAQNPPRKLVELTIFRSQLIAKQGPLAIHRAMRSSYPLSFLLLPHRASRINSPL
jgi:hypothetical protein